MHALKAKKTIKIDSISQPTRMAVAFFSFKERIRQLLSANNALISYPDIKRQAKIEPDLRTRSSMSNILKNRRPDFNENK